MPTVIEYDKPLEIFDSSFVTSLTLSREGRWAYSGVVSCEEHSPDGGRFELGWYAKWRRPTSRDGIDLTGVLGDNEFTHSPEFDKALRDYLTEMICAPSEQ